MVILHSYCVFKTKTHSRLKYTTLVHILVIYFFQITHAYSSNFSFQVTLLVISFLLPNRGFPSDTSLRQFRLHKRGFAYTKMHNILIGNLPKLEIRCTTYILCENQWHISFPENGIWMISDIKLRLYKSIKISLQNGLDILYFFADFGYNKKYPGLVGSINART